MPLARYLSQERVVLLKAVDRHGALEELVEAICRNTPGLDFGEVLSEVEVREKEISTRVAPEVAIPHARIPGFGSFVLAVGFSAAGMEWGSPEEEPVRLVLLLIGDSEEAREHIRILSQLAAILRTGKVLNRLEQSAGSAGALYRALVELQETDGIPRPADEAIANRVLYENACRICKEIHAAAVLVLTDERTDLSFIRGKPDGCDAFLVTGGGSLASRTGECFDAVLEAPVSGLAVSHRIEVAVLSVVSSGMAQKGHTLVCVYGSPQTGRLDAIKVVDVERDFERLLSLRSQVRSGDIDDQVLYGLLNIATELAREGREGKPVGLLFVLGDAEQVLARSQQMVVNPFKGHPEEERNALDPSLHDTLKEFSVIDGAIVIRGDGVIVSAGTYLNTQGVSVSLSGGLGSRHAAAAAISAATEAVALVVSESTGTVRLFKGGQQILSLKKDLR